MRGGGPLRGAGALLRAATGRRHAAAPRARPLSPWQWQWQWQWQWRRAPTARVLFAVIASAASTATVGARCCRCDDDGGEPRLGGDGWFSGASNDDSPPKRERKSPSRTKRKPKKDAEQPDEEEEQQTKKKKAAEEEREKKEKKEEQEKKKKQQQQKEKEAAEKKKKKKAAAAAAADKAVATPRVEPQLELRHRQRMVFLSGSITDAMAKTIIADLLYLDALEDGSEAAPSGRKPIQLVINSGGGVVTSGLAIYDVMQYIRSPVHTLCIGHASSMAAILLAAGEPGQRRALPHARVMIHSASGGYGRNKVEDVLVHAEELRAKNDLLAAILARHLGLSVEKVMEMWRVDNYMT
jgi:ATP-dependent Clp protease protease subunit